MGLFKKKEEMTPEKQALFDKKTQLISRFTEDELRFLARSNWLVGMLVSRCDDTKALEAKANFGVIYDIENAQITRGLTNSAHLKGSAADFIDAIFNIGDGNPAMPKLTGGEWESFSLNKKREKEDLIKDFMEVIVKLDAMVRSKCEPQEATDFLKFLGGIGVNVAEALCEETNKAGYMVSPTESATLEKIFDAFHLEGADRPPYKKLD